MTTSGSMPGWHPTTPTRTAQPVQVESANGGLTGCALPNGTALLMWPNGSAVKCAVIASPSAWMTDNVVPSGDVRTAINHTYTVHQCACYMVGSDLFCTVLADNGSQGRVEIYKANSATNPTSWSLHGTVQTATLLGSGGANDTTNAGIPLVLGSGRWVLVGGAYHVWNFGGTDAWNRRIAGWYSDDGGVTWTVGFTAGLSFLDTLANAASGQVGRDPATGDLYAVYETTEGAQTTSAFARSTDNGATWSTTADIFNDPVIAPVLNNGNELYGFAFHPSNLNGLPDIYELTSTPGDDRSAWTNTGEDYWPSARSLSHALDKVKVIGAGGVVYVFYRELVAAFPSQWFVGFVGWA